MNEIPRLSVRAVLRCVVVTLVMVSVQVNGSSPTVSNVDIHDARDSGTGQKTRETSILSETDSPLKTNQVVVRFYLIRHGETLANDENLVLGQTDSPLKESGESQARALGRTNLIVNETFWRKYTSDLGRAQRTAHLILGEDRSLDEHNVQLEPLLREMAKGAREMLPKQMTYDEAEALFRKEHGSAKPFPLLETEDEVVSRVYQWMFRVLQEAIQDRRMHCTAADSKEGDQPDSQQIYAVFAVSHSATLRAIIGRLVRDQLPSGIDFSPVGKDGATKRALKVPNTSVTIIDVIPRNVDDEVWDPERQSQAPPNPSMFWNAELQVLTYTEHSQYI